MKNGPNDNEKTFIPWRLAALACILAFATAANAANSYWGVSVNGKCFNGTSCPAELLPYNTTVTLPVTYTFTLPNGDKYLLNGSSWGSNNNNGSYLPAAGVFQITYQGNSAGGASAADTITVDWYLAFESIYSSCNCEFDLSGAFSPDIAASSSVSACFNGSTDCQGPYVPPGSFNEGGTIYNVPTAGFVESYTINFGAGSAVGSYIVFDQSVALPLPTIASFSPAAGRVGSLVTITGTNLSGDPGNPAFPVLTTVTFNGVAADISVDSSTQITATVPAGALTGEIRIVTADGIAASTGKFKVIPSETGTVTVNATDEISGAGFSAVTTTDGTGTLPVGIPLVTGATSVTFEITGGSLASACAWPCISVNYGDGNNYNDADGTGSAEGLNMQASGPISGITASVAGYLAGVFESGGQPSGAPPPTLNFTTIGTDFTSLSPLLSQLFFIGDGLTGLGQVQYFDVPAGATVFYLGIPDACSYDSTPSCYADNWGYFVVSYTVYTSSMPPNISYFSPASGSVGDSVTITGPNLEGATAVTFNGVAATFTQDGNTQITAIVPKGATTGPIQLTTSVGTATGKTTFMVQ